MSLFTSAQPLNRSMKLILSNKRLTRRSISSSSTSQSSSASSSSATGSDTTSSSSTGGSSGQSDHANPSTGKRWSFFVSTAFHGKPTEQDEPGMKRRAKPARLLQGFAPDSAIARWRDSSLENAPWGAGHDWFFVQPIPSSSAGSSGTTREGLVLGIADGVGGKIS
jgi:protein phosphatase PTC7